jgi:N-acyl-D-amino-acid deacylase
MKRLIILFMTMLSLLVGCQQSDSLPTTGEYKSGMGGLDRAFIRLMEKWEIPGGALAVTEDGELVLARGYGYADVEQGERVQPDALFRIASVSKSITAAAALKLVEEAMLSLETPVFELLDDLKPLERVHVDPRINEITVRNLLEHTGGWDSSRSFDPMFMAREIGQEMGLSGPADCTAIIRFMLGQPLDFNPGSRYAYSNFGYCVLGRVIEKVSGQTYEVYVRAQLLEPAGVVGMRLGQSLLAERGPGEVRYYAAEAGLVPSVFPENTESVPWPYGGFYLEAMDAHGGWIASAADLARFAAALEQTDGALLQPGTITIIEDRPESAGFVYGWKVRAAGKSANWWSVGSFSGTSAVLYRTSSGLIWVALFNTNPNTPGDEFLVDVITTMGRAVFMQAIGWVMPAAVVLILGVGTFFASRRPGGLRKVVFQ